MYIAASTKRAADHHPRGQALTPNSTAKNAAHTGSIVMMMAARVGGSCACAQVWPRIVSEPR
jgi:hypothetical protein